MLKTSSRPTNVCWDKSLRLEKEFHPPTENNYKFNKMNQGVKLPDKFMESALNKTHLQTQDI